MAKRYNARALKMHHCYTAEQVAETLGAHPQTIRAWVNSGLPCMKSKIPHLFVGAHVQDFLAQQSRREKQRLAPDELYCLGCKAGKIPDGLITDFISDGTGRGRLIGLCPDCERFCNRFVNEAQIPTIAPNLAVTHQTREPSLKEPNEAARKTQKQEHH